MSDRNRQLSIVGLVILTFGLVGAAIFLANALQQNQAPVNSSAASSLTTCILAARPDILPFYKSNGWDTSASNYDAIVANWKIISPSQYASVAATCNGGSASSSSAGTNVGTFTTGSEICGQACNTTSDCAISQGGGFQPICVNNKCVSPKCTTDYNANPQCACKTSTSTCGQKCGIWSDGFYPLCTGNSTCSWINGPTCGGNNETYCMPVSPQNGYTAAACTAVASYKYLIAPNGSPITTQAQIQAACSAVSAPPPAATPVCGDGVCNGTETTASCSTDCPAVARCGDGVCSGSETHTSCSADCAALPNTAVISDDVDRVIVGMLLVIIGGIVYAYHRKMYPTSQDN